VPIAVTSESANPAASRPRLFSGIGSSKTLSEMTRSTMKGMATLLQHLRSKRSPGPHYPFRRSCGATEYGQPRGCTAGRIRRSRRSRGPLRMGLCVPAPRAQGHKETREIASVPPQSSDLMRFGYPAPAVNTLSPASRARTSRDRRSKSQRPSVRSPRRRFLRQEQLEGAARTQESGVGYQPFLNFQHIFDT
jgi:hypothetical protein